MPIIMEGDTETWQATGSSTEIFGKISVPVPVFFSLLAREYRAGTVHLIPACGG